MRMVKVDSSGHHCGIPSSFGKANQLARLIWGIVYVVMFRPSPRGVHSWRRLILRLFGARIGVGAEVDPSVRIWAPWNLEMEAYSSLGFGVDCYCVAQIRLGCRSVISQYSFLCSATHDYNNLFLPLKCSPITIGAHAWVCADSFIGPGVRIGEGAVVGARSSVFRDVPDWTVVAGSPARRVRDRVIQNNGGQVCIAPENPAL